MKTITISIGEFFSKLEDKYKIKFENDKFVTLDDNLKIKDENDKWVTINGFIKKEDAIHEIKFNNGITKKVAAGHLISVEPFFEPESCTTRLAKDFEPGDDIPYLGTKCISNYALYSYDNGSYSVNDGVISVEIPNSSKE